MIKKTGKAPALVLRKETIAKLTRKQLELVVGAEDPLYTIPVSACASCST